ncbi:MAG: ATP synthase F1 subunit gamma [Planctomycetes bacterium]|nr:ATP synthase F1 subunit gamma [Planctomycetota bacterium]
MPSLKQIRNRIRSVKSTQQITRVMQMVSASKLARAQNLLFQALPYARELEALMGRIVAGLPSGPEAPPVPNPFLQARSEMRRGCLVVFTSDRGLCGAYNNNVIGLAERHLAGDRSRWTLACVGKKGRAYFAKRGWSIGYEMIDTQGRVQPQQVKDLSHYLASGFQSGQFEGVLFAATSFHSVSRFGPKLVRFLPIEPVAHEGKADDYLFEPGPREVLDRLVPEFLSAKLNTTLYEALASEHAARMMAMRNATDNASEMIQTLTLQMNKARQASITKEIAEIVGGAEAIKG